MSDLTLSFFPLSALSVCGKQLVEYLAGGNLEVVNADLETFLWRAPGLVADHSGVIASEAAAHILGAVKSWYPSLDLQYPAQGFYPEASDVEIQEYISSALPLVEQLIQRMDLNPHPEPLKCRAPEAGEGPSGGQTEAGGCSASRSKN